MLSHISLRYMISFSCGSVPRHFPGALRRYFMAGMDVCALYDYLRFLYILSAAAGVYSANNPDDTGSFIYLKIFKNESEAVMIKGCQKKMVIVKNISSDIFDEAYFILKDDGKFEGIKNDDMVSEANRIVASGAVCMPSREGSSSLRSGFGGSDRSFSGDGCLPLDFAEETAGRTAESILKGQGFYQRGSRLRMLLAFVCGVAAGAIPAILYMLFRS